MSSAKQQHIDSSPNAFFLFGKSKNRKKHFESKKGKEELKDDINDIKEKQITHVQVSSKLKTIERHTFSGCSSLVTIILPESITEIGAFAFDGCTALEQISIPNSITKIEYDTFRGCSSLVKIILPESITSIGGCAFDGCTALEQISIPNSITRIGSYTFHGCESLIQMILPESITEIGYRAFWGCSSLVHIYLPNQLQTIDREAFKECSNLSIIAVPDHVTIPPKCFDGCTIINTVQQQLNLPDNDYNFLHYQHRFANRPLHRVCYDPKLTLQSLTTAIEAVANNSINNTDDFSMNALHILCSNPNVSPRMISTFVKAHPSLRTMRSIDNMTPLMVFMTCKGIVSHAKMTWDEVERISFHSCLQRRIAWKDIRCMLLMDAEMNSELMVQDEQTGLYPLMEPALDTESSYGLECMFRLLYAHPFLLSRN